MGGWGGWLITPSKQVDLEAPKGEDQISHMTKNKT
jgi:hypothetical protein